MVWEAAQKLLPQWTGAALKTHLCSAPGAGAVITWVGWCACILHWIHALCTSHNQVMVTIALRVHVERGYSTQPNEIMDAMMFYLEFCIVSGLNIMSGLKATQKELSPGGKCNKIEARSRRKKQISVKTNYNWKERPCLPGVFFPPV